MKIKSDKVQYEKLHRTHFKNVYSNRENFSVLVIRVKGAYTARLKFQWLVGWVFGCSFCFWDGSL